MVGMPPDTARISPLTKLASSDAKNTKAGEHSLGWPALPVGVIPAPMVVTMPPVMLAGMIGVQMGPGATAHHK